jgi:hypothetical protein
MMYDGRRGWAETPEAQEKQLMSFPRTAEFLWAASVLLTNIAATSGAAEVRDESDPTMADYYIVVEYQDHDGGPGRVLWGVCEDPTDGVRVERGYGGAGDHPALIPMPHEAEVASRQPINPRRLFVKTSRQAFKATLTLAAFDTTRHPDGRTTAYDVASLVSALATYLDLDREVLTGRRPSEKILTAKPRQPLRKQARQAVPLSSVPSQPDPVGEAEAIRQLNLRAEADEHKQQTITENLKSLAFDRSHRNEDAYERRTSEFAQRGFASAEIMAKEQAEEVDLGNDANATSLVSKVAVIRERNEQKMRDAEAHARSTEAEFSERARKLRDYWIANGRKLGEMLIAAFTGGAGGGSMMSGLTSMIGGSQVGEIATGAGVTEAAGPGAPMIPRFDPNNPRQFEAYLDSLAGNSSAKATFVHRMDVAIVGGASDGKPNGGRAEEIFGSIGKYSAAAGAAVASSYAKTPTYRAASGALGAAASDAGQKAGEAIGRAVDRHAERLKKEYEPKSDPRYDPRSLFDPER